MRSRFTRSVVFCLLALVTGPLLAAKLDRAKQVALQRAAELESETEQLSNQLWELSETALRETESAELLATTLEQAGFEVERGVAGMPTAFVARWGEGRPIVGVLAEYDALPGVGNEARPERAPRQDGVSSGHGCGHNLFGAASVVGAIAIKETMASEGIPGTIRLYGTPAEETVIGKVYMARDGLFDDLDAAIDWHPGTTTETRNQPGRAMNSFTVEFFGQAAHGSRDPWNGRSALDAVELMDYGVNLMREHIEPSTRIHYVITDGGDAPNVVPEYAKVWYYVRDVDRDRVQHYYDRILKIAEGAALATETTHQVTLLTGVYECLLLRTLQEAVQANLEAVGGPEFTAAEQEFGHRLQRSLGIAEAGFVGTVEPLAPEPKPLEGGSSDVCDVSHIVPEIGFRVTTAASGIPWHSWAATACHGTSAGIKGARVASKVIALTGIDLLVDSELLAAARAEFSERKGSETYHSPIPPDQTPPLPGE